MLLFLLGVAVGALGAYLILGGAQRRGGVSAAEWLRQEAASRDRESQAQEERDARGGSAARRRNGAGHNGAGREGAAARGGRSSATPAAGTLGGDQGTAGRAGLRGAGGTEGIGAAGSAAAGAVTGAARVALVIDDLGRSLGELDDLRQLGVPITYAVLPFEVQTPEVVAALRRRHEEILCHLPMEPKSGGNPGPGALRAGMSAEELRRSTLAAIAAVPGAVGVNNHMGSALSADPGSMSTILSVLAAHGLYFLDSRTSAQSVGFRVANALGVPAAERQVFLDDDPKPEAVAAEFQRLLELARTRGAAIAIGHPHPATLATLAAEVPRAQALGYRFVVVSALLDHPAAASPPPADGD
ncbi:MAG TPA: divergent polysaccharide deacetylase family protein [Thermoanaerobaculia bacterium]|nr:divergent polysaccharide deacetylase family protein [Thermoanaerobaculia bacterium]